MQGRGRDRSAHASTRRLTVTRRKTGVRTGGDGGEGVLGNGEEVLGHGSEILEGIRNTIRVSQVKRRIEQADVAAN